MKRVNERGEFPHVAIGKFPLSKIPDGKYRIYYFRPKDRNRMLGNPANWSMPSSAKDKIQRVGKGQEFYIFDKNTSSQSPSKKSSMAASESQYMSVKTISQQSNSITSSKKASKKSKKTKSKVSKKGTKKSTTE